MFNDLSLIYQDFPGFLEADSLRDIPLNILDSIPQKILVSSWDIAKVISIDGFK